jgi:hypothetical protein
MITALGKLNMALAKTIAYSHEETVSWNAQSRDSAPYPRNTLRKYATQRGLKCALVQRIMNATKHSATGYAPASIITPGIDLNEGILFHTVLPGDTTSLRNTLNCSMTTSVCCQQSAVSIKHTKHKQRYANKHTTTSFPKDSFVLVSYPRDPRANQTTHALARTFSGPLQ